LFASIHIVTEEKVVCFGWEAAVLEETKKVIVLAVYVATNLSDVDQPKTGLNDGNKISYLDRRLQFKQDRLRDKDLSSLGAQMADLSFKQLDLLAGPTSSHLQEPIYDGIQVHLILHRHCHRLEMADGTKTCYP
jgi:hypothetical protein